MGQHEPAAADDEPRAEVLCRHHSLESFSSGHSESDMLARELLEKAKAWDPMPIPVAVAVGPGPSREILGIIAAKELMLFSDRDADGNPVPGGNVLFYYLLAVTEDHVGGPVGRILHREFISISRRRVSEGDHYIGEMAAPERGQSAHGERLIHMLEQLGFRQLETMDLFWFRPKDPPSC